MLLTGWDGSCQGLGAGFFLLFFTLFWGWAWVLRLGVGLLAGFGFNWRFTCITFGSGCWDGVWTRPLEATWMGREQAKRARAWRWLCRGSNSWGVIPWAAWIPNCALFCFIFRSAGFVDCFTRRCLNRVPHTLFAPIGHAKSHRTLRCLHTFLWWLSPSPWRSPGDYLIRQQTRRGQTRLAEPAPRSGTAVEPAGSSEDPELGKAPNPEPRTGSPTTTGTLPQPAQQITTQIPSCATQGTGNSSRKHWEIKCGAPCASQVPLQPSC